MHKQNDPYTYFETLSLQAGNSAIGSTLREFTAKLYDDVRMCGIDTVGTTKTSRKYKVDLTQRVRVCNTSSIGFANSTAIYQNYPVLFTALLDVSTADTSIIKTLMSYSPLTVNTKVSTAGSQSDQNGTTQSVALGSTSGSTQSQTNSFGASVSVSMEGPTASANYEHSDTTTIEKSNSSTFESGRSSGKEDSSSATMSIKDWGSYALVAPDNTVLWTFGQEYPWDAIQFRQFCGAGTSQQQLNVPQAILARMYDYTTGCLFPPSHLSVFGFDFVMKSMWLIEVPNGETETLEIVSDLGLYTASHTIVTNPNTAPDEPATTVVIARDVAPTSLGTSSANSLATTVDLALLALDPIGVNSDTATIGFVKNKFTILPAPPSNGGTPSNFSIPSTSNQVIARDVTDYGSGSSFDSQFSATDQGIIASFGSANNALTVRLLFKITNTHQDYVLFVKNWTLNSIPIQLDFVINGNTSVTRLLNAAEGEGGENNITTIKLRDLNFGSVDFHDYLQLGLNTIDISIQPTQPGTTVQECYQLLAVSIEND